MIGKLFDSLASIILYFAYISSLIRFCQQCWIDFHHRHIQRHRGGLLCHWVGRIAERDVVAEIRSSG